MLAQSRKEVLAFLFSKQTKRHRSFLRRNVKESLHFFMSNAKMGNQISSVLLNRRDIREENREKNREENRQEAELQEVLETSEIHVNPDLKSVNGRSAKRRNDNSSNEEEN